jgi:hypothetical protein
VRLSASLFVEAGSGSDEPRSTAKRRKQAVEIDVYPRLSAERSGVARIGCRPLGARADCGKRLSAPLSVGSMSPTPDAIAAGVRLLSAERSLISPHVARLSLQRGEVKTRGDTVTPKQSRCGWSFYISVEGRGDLARQRRDGYQPKSSPKSMAGTPRASLPLIGKMPKHYSTGAKQIRASARRLQLRRSGFVGAREELGGNESFAAG